MVAKSVVDFSFNPDQDVSKSNRSCSSSLFRTENVVKMRSSRIIKIASRACIS